MRGGIRSFPRTSLTMILTYHIVICIPLEYLTLGQDYGEVTVIDPVQLDAQAIAELDSTVSFVGSIDQSISVGELSDLPPDTVIGDCRAACNSSSQKWKKSEQQLSRGCKRPFTEVD